MNGIKKVIHIIDTVNDWIGKIGAWSVLVLTFLVVFEVISRRVLNSPTIWTYETITMVYGFHFMIVAAYALLHKSMVSVDIIYEKFPLKTRAWLDLCTYVLFFFPFVVGIFWIGMDYAAKSWAIKETSSSLFSPPVYPLKTVIPVAFGLLLLQGISEVLKRIVILVKGETV
ncbi:TRAP-type mannitol/chloroaromatic compound transport system permease small subunit [Caldalkalibacillus uzonensis]|uniref:TRAP-type mannitol/chloroaromatic compound transport system permease small subunit n=1 Tax=Caldalkalibacillus uzonensis TaxID=353224 RepID=A0ABU0CNC0_9BACI|nr:TRAP transporter small permease subunit [Caldalkalibacillus uzonensis]MDQ0337914.1 TRAP-type mannitol/chloroaromatic compound transport system permease small subunit [Caldalkalibacillus uzonensis]